MLNQMLYIGQFHATRSWLALNANVSVRVIVCMEGPSWLTASEGRHNTTTKS